MSQQPGLPDHPHQKPSSGGGALKWVIIVLVILIVLIGGCVLTCMLTWSSFAGAVTAPVTDLAEYLETHPEASGKLGTPIEQVGLFDGGTFNVSVNGNNAEVECTVKGPNGQAEASGDMMFSDGTWKPTQMILRFDDGTTFTSVE